MEGNTILYVCMVDKPTRFKIHNSTIIGQTNRQTEKQHYIHIRTDMASFYMRNIRTNSLTVNSILYGEPITYQILYENWRCNGTKVSICWRIFFRSEVLERVFLYTPFSILRPLLDAPESKWEAIVEYISR